MIRSILTAFILITISLPAHAGKSSVTSYIKSVAAENGDIIRSIEWCEECGYYWVEIKGSKKFDAFNLHNEKMYLPNVYCKPYNGADKFGITVVGSSERRRFNELCQ